MKDMIRQIGQLFVIGFTGEEPPKAFLNFIAEENIGGVIFFEENCPTHQQARHNVELIMNQYESSTPFIAIDQEGGRVCRLKGAP